MLSTMRQVARNNVPPRALRLIRDGQRLLSPRADSPMTDIIGEGRCGDVTIRALRRSDSAAWSRAMLSNFERMSQWWSLDRSDPEVATDALAFEHHLHAWEQRRRRGEGICLALAGPDGLIGEIQLWHMSDHGMTCELGMWMAPADSGVKRAAAACVGCLYDSLFADLGIQRIDAPVAVGNLLPRPLLELWGFEIEATIPRWRPLDGDLADYDLFTLTPHRWEQARERVGDTLGRFERVTPTP